MCYTASCTITEKQELLFARLSAATAIGIAGYLGINPPGFVAQVVAFAFGLAAASLFPAIFMGTLPQWGPPFEACWCAPRMGLQLLQACRHL